MKRKVTIYKPTKKKQEKKQFQVIDLLQDFQMSKFFFILYTQDFAFDWDLKKKYNFTQKQIQDYSRTLEELQLCSFQLLGELSFNLKEAVLRTTPHADKIDQQNPKVYTITKTGRKEGKELITQIVKDSQTHEGLYNLIKQLIESSNSFRQVKKQIKELEENAFERSVTLPDGTLFIKPTNRLREAKKHIQDITQQKQELLSNNSSSFQELAVKDRNTQLQLYNTNTQDNSLQHRNIQHLSKEDELILKQQFNGISDKEVKEVEKEYSKQIKDKLQELRNETAHYEKEEHKLFSQKFETTIGKYYLNKKEPIEEGLAFLDSLETIK